MRTIISTTAAATAALATAAALELSTGTANAGPYCYETGPGYQKCVDGSSGGFFNPIYQGPKVVDNGSLPWAPSYVPPPAYAPSVAAPAAPNLNALADGLARDIQDGIDANPDNAQAQIRVLHVSVTRTGDTTFEAVATMAAAGHAPRDIPVHVFNTDTGTRWQIDPGAMAPLFQ